MLSIILPAVLAFASVASAIPVGGTSLPGTQQLNVYEGSTLIGCLNGYGNFTTDTIFCYPFRSFTSTDGFAYLQRYAECSTVGELVCYDGTDAVDNQFYVSVVRNTHCKYKTLTIP